MFLLALLAALITLHASAGSAQTWSDGHTDPSLVQIVAIDRTGETDFVYGREDVAGDGLGTFSAAEAAADLRTIYASADAMRLWLRAYVAGTAAPAANARVFFFIDRDARDSSGGPARGGELDEALAADPSSGGYELALGVRGNGMLLGVWEWNGTMRRWVELADARAPEVAGEVGTARDPIVIFEARHGYAQLSLAHSISGLTASCGATFFVRMLDDGPAMRSYADDVEEEFACHARADERGVPELLRPAGCDSDAQCPARGRCVDGVCLFTPGCESADDCPDGYSCEQSRCVRTVSGTCDSAADCDGLVCEGRRCAACSESGARACSGGLTCSPDGSCVNPGDLGGTGSRGATGPGKVRGGALSCALRAERSPTGSLSLLALAWLAWRVAKRRAERTRRSL